jgi:hypothetical protein
VKGNVPLPDQVSSVQLSEGIFILGAFQMMDKAQPHLSSQRLVAVMLQQETLSEIESQHLSPCAANARWLRGRRRKSAWRLRMNRGA